MACVTLYLVVAWRVMYVLMRGRQTPAISCDTVFDDAEWQAVYQMVNKKRATTPPTLGDMVEWVASFGGYLGRQRHGHPGPKTFWIGMQRVRDFAAGYELAQALGKT